MRESSATVVVSGTINVDTFVGVENFPNPGETVIGTRGIEGLGGKGANQAVACAHLGVRTVLLSAVGQDSQGELAITQLKQHGVNTEHVAETRHPTGQAFIMNDQSGENIIIVTSGANALVSPAQQRKTVDMLRSQGPVPVVLAQGELTPDHSAELPRLVAGTDTRLVLNLAPVTTRDRDLIAAADPLILNEGEAADVLGVPRDTPLEEIFAALHGIAKSVVVTLGPQGAVILTQDAEPVRVPAVRVQNVVDTTGAGDAFCGTLAAALAQGESLEEACRLGAAAGALATQKAGAAGSYASELEVRALAEE
ncbi:MAG TPA: ribokinase [Candidatus Corynebacterium gallistercoris]|uniref:Ribokinase n=1 Tax=Candidatus Corynebacterium gallistercoris TaxID=2838530 RepID=A0A9D1UQG2_9CORY|nr:ribokinase [Candidatus Corynebacterium gallistercoris]